MGTQARMGRWTISEALYLDSRLIANWDLPWKTGVTFVDWDILHNGPCIHMETAFLSPIRKRYIDNLNL